MLYRHQHLAWLQPAALSSYSWLAWLAQKLWQWRWNNGEEASSITSGSMWRKSKSAVNGSAAKSSRRHRQTAAWQTRLRRRQK